MYKIIGEVCVVRTASAGVHIGVVEEHTGTVVYLSASRRLWSWNGANTLNEVALHGVDESSKISEAVPYILLTEAIELIPCSAKAKANLSKSRW